MGVLQGSVADPTVEVSEEHKVIVVFLIGQTNSFDGGALVS